MGLQRPGEGLGTQSTRFPGSRNPPQAPPPELAPPLSCPAPRRTQRPPRRAAAQLEDPPVPPQPLNCPAQSSLQLFGSFPFMPKETDSFQANLNLEILSRAHTSPQNNGTVLGTHSAQSVVRGLGQVCARL